MNEPYDASGVKVTKIDDVASLLSAIQRTSKAYLFLGEPLGDLYTTFTAYMYGLESGFALSNEDFPLADFLAWGKTQLDCFGTEDLYACILRNHSADEAFEKFFELWRSYNDGGEHS